MPELAEVNLQVRYLREHPLTGPIESFGCTTRQHCKKLHDRDLALAEFLTGNTLTRVTQRGKRVILHTERGPILSHLMFRGRWSVQGTPFISPYKHHKEPPTDASRTFWLIDAHGARLNFHTPENMAKVSIHPGAFDLADLPVVSSLGPEVHVTPETDPAFASNPWDLAAFTTRANRSRQAIKAFLLDQKKQSGLGNMYVCEALYLARVAPTRPANTLNEDALQKIHHHARDILQRAIDTYLDYDALLNVYRREHDPEGNAVEVTKVGGRDSFWVPAVQA